MKCVTHDIQSVNKLKTLFKNIYTQILQVKFLIYDTFLDFPAKLPTL